MQRWNTNLFWITRTLQIPAVLFWRADVRRGKVYSNSTGGFRDIHRIWPEAVWSAVVCPDAVYLRLVCLIPFRQILFCLRLFLLWCCFSETVLPNAALSDLQLNDSSVVTLFLPVVRGRSLERMLPFRPISAWVCPKKTRSTSQRVPFLCVLSPCSPFFFRVAHSQLLCTAGTLSIMIYLCNLAVKCTQLATWMGIKEPAPGSDNTSEMERWVGIVEDSLCCDTEGTLWRSNACEGAPRSCQSSTIKTSMSPRHSKEIMRKGFL